MVNQLNTNKNTTCRLADAIGHLGLPNAIIKKEKKKYYAVTTNVQVFVVHTVFMELLLQQSFAGLKKSSVLN